jgi:protease-4
VAVLAASAACLLRAAPVRAQAILPEASDPATRPTRGPLITDAHRAGDADATDVELNPGSLALLPGSSLELVGAAGNGAAMPRRGAGLYWATPLLGSSALGLGLTGVAASEPAFIDHHVTFRLAYALRLGRGAGLGVAWGHLWGGALGGTNTFDFGLSLRFGRFVALGATVEDVAQPSGLPRLWNAELVLRPTGTDRFALTVGAAHANATEWERIVPRARLSLVLTTGLRLYAEGERVPRGTALVFSGGADTRAGLGLAFDFGHAGGAVAGYTYVPGVGNDGGGVAARLHVAGERRMPLAAPGYVARVSVEGTEDEHAFVALVRRLRTLAVDPGAIGVVFKIEDVPLGMGRVEELRELMALLRARGKRVFAYVTTPPTRAYYLAAAADAIYLHPAGELSLTGLSQTVTFYKSAMDKLGVRVELLRVGAYKGAMEPFIQTEQSPEVRANKARLLDDVYARLTASIAADRTRTGHPMDAAAVRAAVDRALYTPGEAQLAGLVDGIVDETELETAIARALGRSQVSIRDAGSAFASGAWPGRRVAVVLVDGTIVDGPGNDLPFGLGDFAGSDTIVAALEKCRSDGTVAAVVLRVNSPGGSAFASDVMARAIGKVRAAGKPVIVSMGDVAASGGYYIAAPADQVFADPSTITGSIGVFGFKLDVAKLIGMLGISVETTRRGAHADIQSPYRAWTEEEVRMEMDKIRHIYTTFVDVVATGRKSRGLTPARVDEIGRGQVWTGGTAQTLGLVDKLGGLSDAIDEASRLTRVPLGPDRMPELEVLPKPRRGLLQRAIGLASASAEEDAASPDPAATEQPASILSVFLATPEGRAAVRLLAPLIRSGGAGVAARLPYDIEIR